MKKIERRAVLCLVLAGLLLAGLALFLFRFFFFSCSCHANWPSIRAFGSSADVFSSESLKSLPESKPPSVSSNNCSKQTPSGAEGGSLTSLLTSSLMLRRSFAFSSIT